MSEGVSRLITQMFEYDLRPEVRCDLKTNGSVNNLVKCI